MKPTTEELVAARCNRCSHYPSPITALGRSLSSMLPVTLEDQAVPPEQPPSPLRLKQIITWIPRQFLRSVFAFINFVASQAWILVVLPTIWIAASLLMLWNCVLHPLGLLKILGGVISRKVGLQCTVLIGGGSSVQALHLARNCHSTGARVIVVEVEGQFAILKHSAVVHKFYTVPRTNPADPLAYVRALKEIAKRESVVFYIPVSSSTPAYYDALAKPHLELLGCQCFVPYAREVVALDDPLELMRVCLVAGLPTPRFWVVTSEDDVRAWYDNEVTKGERHFIASAGERLAWDRLRFVMPKEKANFRFTREISAKKPWIIVQEPKGEKFMTYTTLDKSRAVNNVTCRVGLSKKSLVVKKNEEIDAWVQSFVTGLSLSEPLTGQLSFKLVREENKTNEHGSRMVAIGARVGESLPYLCEKIKRCGHKATAGMSRSSEEHLLPRTEPCKTLLNEQL